MSVHPGSAIGLWMRHEIMKLLAVPFVSGQVVNPTASGLGRETFVLKDYGPSEPPPRSGV